MTNEELRELYEQRMHVCWGSQACIQIMAQLAEAVPRLLDDIAARDKVIKEVREWGNRNLGGAVPRAEFDAILEKVRGNE